jgi:ATP-dependent DNA helicase RecG
VQDFLVLDHARLAARLPKELQPQVPHLLEAGVIERAGGGKYLLSRRFYEFLGEKGVYTRQRGLDRETNKELLLKHIRENDGEGSKLSELMQVLPSHSRNQVQKLLKELKDEGKIHNRGFTSAARWHLGNVQEKLAPKT